MKLSTKKCCDNASHRDLDTGLPNEYGIIREINRLIKKKTITEYACIYFNIAKMTLLNSRCGRKAGDKAIKDIIRIIQDSLESDEILGRSCSDRFFALIKKEHVSSFLDTVGNLHIIIKTDNGKTDVNLSAVSGVYEIPGNDILAQDIIACARNAYSYAKTIAKKPYVLMNRELERALSKNRVLEEEIRLGLQNKEFIPFYQPKIDSRTSAVIGAEALARWYHKGQYISPAIFIPVMEQTNMIVGLDFMILEKVCEDLRNWISEGLPVVEISVNFSKADLEIPDFARRVHKIITEYGIPDNLIQVELTETLDDMSVSNVNEILKSLHGYGISTAIDDFGSGSSSILLLKYADFSQLKIDKSFVNYKDEREKQLLRNVIRLAHDMGIDVIAEGVETKEQAFELDSMGCFKHQGYLYSKPLDKTGFETQWLTENITAV